MSNCKDKLIDTCGGKKHNARCIDYEGDLSVNSSLDCDCTMYSLQDVIEDINSQLDDATGLINVDDIEKGCLEFEVENPNFKQLLAALIAKACEAGSVDCNSIMSTPIECADLNFECFEESCGVTEIPTTIGGLFQLLIDQSCKGCEETPPTPIDKLYYYRERVLTVVPNEVNIDPPGPSGYAFIHGYENIQYQNTTGSPVSIEVNVSYSKVNISSSNYGGYTVNKLDSALIRTTSIGSEVIEYKRDGLFSINPLISDDIEVEQSTSYFKYMTLLPNETIALKFKAETPATKIIDAQISIREV